MGDGSHRSRAQLHKTALNYSYIGGGWVCVELFLYDISDKTCGYTVNYKTGLIGTNDVNVNEIYPDVSCTWVITSHVKSTFVDLMIVAINIQDQDNCTSHHLKV